MATNTGTLVTGPVRPFDTADNYPVLEDLYLKGGFRTVADQTERDAIPAERRQEGMYVLQNDTGLIYRLASDLTTWNVTGKGAMALYDTYALANADVANVEEGAVVEVFVDETRNSRRTRYTVQSGALVFKHHLDSYKPPLRQYLGALIDDETVLSGERALGVDLTIPDGLTLTIEDTAVMVVL